MSETIVEQQDDEELTLDQLDQLDGVVDDDELDGSDPGGELDDEVDEGCLPDDDLEDDVVPAQGGPQ